MEENVVAEESDRSVTCH